MSGFVCLYMFLYFFVSFGKKRASILGDLIFFGFIGPQSLSHTFAIIILPFAPFLTAFTKIPFFFKTKNQRFQKGAKRFFDSSQTNSSKNTCCTLKAELNNLTTPMFPKRCPTSKRGCKVRLCRAFKPSRFACRTR